MHDRKQVYRDFADAVVDDVTRARNNKLTGAMNISTSAGYWESFELPGCSENESRLSDRSRFVLFCQVLKNRVELYRARRDQRTCIRQL